MVLKSDYSNFFEKLKNEFNINDLNMSDYFEKENFLIKDILIKKGKFKSIIIKESINEIENGLIKIDLSSGNYLFYDKNRLNSYYKINIRENSKVNLFFFFENNSRIEIDVDVGERSKLNIVQNIFSLDYLKSIINLKKNSNYNLKSSFFIREGNAIIENTSRHLEENSNSDLKVFGVGMGNSRISNDGKITILNNAKKSIAHQDLRNLLFSKNSSITSLPILEVFNSNVECSHSSSISKISEEELFFIQSRGIGEKEIPKIFFEGILNISANIIEDKKIRDFLIEKRERNILQANFTT